LPLQFGDQVLVGKFARVLGCLLRPQVIGAQRDFGDFKGTKSPASLPFASDFFFSVKMYNICVSVVIIKVFSLQLAILHKSFLK